MDTSRPRHPAASDRPHPAISCSNPDGGECLRFLGASTMRIKLPEGADGAAAFYEYVSEPGVTGPPQHVHHGHDETFYVVDGTFEFTMGPDSALLPRGAFLYVPRDTPHTFRNAGDDPGRIVGTFAPGGSRTTSASWPPSSPAPGPHPTATRGRRLYGRYDTTFYQAS